jgi:hypothetical protein
MGRHNDGRLEMFGTNGNDEILWRFQPCVERINDHRVRAIPDNSVLNIYEANGCLGNASSSATVVGGGEVGGDLGGGDLGGGDLGGGDLGGGCAEIRAGGQRVLVVTAGLPRV